MKHFKTKLGLSVLALACLGAGVISLQPTVSTKADGANESGLVMTNGAMVRVAEGWSGIRWATTVKAGVYDENAVFGVIVAPTKSLVDGDTVIELKHDTVDCELDLIADGFTASATEDTNFYSVINYDNLTQETGIDLKQAYKLELTARAYVQIDGVYYYASLAGINTSRSARQVAIAAELDGALVGDQESAFKYYGDTKYTPSVKSVGAVGTPYIDLQNPTTTVTASIDLGSDTFQEALIGGERVEASYLDGTLTITEANYIPTGEHYITVFTAGGTIYTTPVIGATKVFDEIADFNDFKYIRKNLNNKYKVSATIQETDPDGNPIDASKLVHDGYYVLASNLDTDVNNEGYDPYDYTYEKSGYKFGGYLGIKNFEGKALGLTGTFNGLGHYVKDYRFKRNQSGLFELINGGTVKNFRMADIKGASGDDYSQVAGLAFYAIDATIENVAINTSTNLFADRSQVSMAYYLYQSKKDSFTIRNVYVAMGGAKLTNVGGETLDPLANRFTGGVFAIIHGDSVGDIQWDNVYVRNKYGLSVSWNSGTKDSETGITTYTMNYSYGEFGDQVDENGNYILNYFGKSTLPTDTDTKHYVLKDDKAYCCKGVYVYDSNTNLIADKTKNISALNDDPSKCWKWASQDATSIEFGGNSITL